MEDPTGLVQTLLYPPSPPPLWHPVCRPMQKQHFWKMHFRVKNPVGQENQFLRSGFFIRWKCGAILLKGSPFFPQRTMVWNHFWKSILIFIHMFMRCSRSLNQLKLIEITNQKPLKIMLRFFKLTFTIERLLTMLRKSPFVTVLSNNLTD